MNIKRLINEVKVKIIINIVNMEYKKGLIIIKLISITRYRKEP